jgi:HSP20 family protein
MQLIRRREAWDPFRDMEELSNRMGRLFRWSGGNGEHEALAAADWVPACDITETDSEYRILMELPRIKKEDVHVKLQDGVLSIEGERREETEKKEAKLHRRELSYGHFVRRFTMPADADDARVDATFRDGMLTLTVAKSKSKATSAKEVAIH